MDHPPLVPLLALLGETLFGATPAGLRVLSMLAGALVVVATGLLARAFGGGRFAQVFAGLAALCSPLLLASNAVFQTVPFDQLWWVLAALGVARAVRTDNLRAWLLVGLALGLALLTKYTVLLFGFGLLVGLLVSARTQLRTPGPWLAAAIAVALLLPNLVWQVAHGWPTLEFIANNNANADTSALGFLADQPLMMGIPGLLLWLGGLAWFFSPAGRPFRVLGWLVVTVALVLLLLAGKSYYLGPTYALVWAAGAVGLESWVRHRAPRWRPALLAGFVVLTLPALPVVVPVLPVETMARYELYELNENYAEMLGWPELVALVTGTFDALPADEQATTAIFTASYGEAGALDVLGPPRLPDAVSGHNSYHAWGPPPDATTTVIALGFSEDYLRRFFAEVEPVGTTENPYGVQNEEYGLTVYRCRRPLAPLGAAWADRKHYN